MDSVKIGGEIPVSRVGLGAMRLAGENVWGPYPDEPAGRKFLQDSVEAGINLIDTADVYGPHVNELLIHDALYPYREGLTISTKGGLVRGGVPFATVHPIGHPSYLWQSAMLSARRLGLERIDLYYLHTGFAQDVPFSTQIETLAAIRDEGLIRFIGLSNVSVEQFNEANRITPIAAVTAQFNVLERSNEPLLKAVEAEGALFVPWQPLSLSNPALPATDVRGPGHVQSVLNPIAERHGATQSQIALAWLLQHNDAIVPIPRKHEHRARAPEPGRDGHLAV